MNPQEIYCLEYSTLQKCYHIDTLDRIVKNNRTTVAKNISNGYVIIGVYLTYDEAWECMMTHSQSRTKTRNDYEPFLNPVQ